MRKIRCFDIEWDTTDEEHPEGQPHDLPNEVVIEVEDDFDMEEESADRLSDQFGFCVFNLCVEEEDDYDGIASEAAYCEAEGCNKRFPYDGEDPLLCPDHASEEVENA